MLNFEHIVGGGGDSRETKQQELVRSSTWASQKDSHIARALWITRLKEWDSL